MFFWVFFIVSLLTFLALIALNGLAISRSSGPPSSPTNWWLLTGLSVGHGLIWALMVVGVASFF